MATTKQRNLKGKDTVHIGARVDKELHAILKSAALKKGVSMSTIVENAVRYYIEDELGQKVEQVKISA